MLVGAIIIGSLGFSTNALATLSQEQIKTIVKKEVPNGQLTKFELDRENGRKIYEVEVMDGNVEKEFKIDAETGEVIKFKTEKKVAKDVYKRQLQNYSNYSHLKI